MAKVTKADLSEIHQDKLNLNKHAERGSALTRKSIERFGARLAGVLDRENRIIDGNDRQIAFGEADLNEIEIIEASPDKPVYLRFADLDLADPANPARELQVALHRSAIESFSVDAENLLAAMAEGLDTSDWFRQDELDAMLAGLVAPEPVEDVAPQIDKADELRQKWGVELGQLWQLGAHRLICGDCTDKVTLARLMRGEKADLCLTDPPYGIDDTTSDKNNYDNYDDTRQNLEVLIAGFLPIAREVSKCVVITPGNGNTSLYPVPTWTMAWFTPAGVGRGPGGFCCWQPILCFGKDPKLAKGKGCHPDAIVHTESAEKLGHPCSKPIGFWTWLMERTSEKNEVIYEPFNGSGTTLIACEQLSRQCRAIELDPGYCAITLQRFQDATNIAPILLS